MSLSIRRTSLTPSLWLALSVLAIVQILNLWSAYLGVTVGHGRELNPLVAALPNPSFVIWGGFKIFSLAVAYAIALVSISRVGVFPQVTKLVLYICSLVLLVCSLINLGTAFIH